MYKGITIHVMQNIHVLIPCKLKTACLAGFLVCFQHDSTYTNGIKYVFMYLGCLQPQPAGSSKIFLRIECMYFFLTIMLLYHVCTIYSYIIIIIWLFYSKKWTQLTAKCLWEWRSNSISVQLEDGRDVTKNGELESGCRGTTQNIISFIWRTKIYREMGDIKK